MSEITKQRCDEIADTSGWQSVRELAEQAKACVDLRRENEQLRALLRAALSFVRDPSVFKIQSVEFVGTREDAVRAINAILNGEREEP